MDLRYISTEEKWEKYTAGLKEMISLLETHLEAKEAELRGVQEAYNQLKEECDAWREWDEEEDRRYQENGCCDRCA